MVDHAVGEDFYHSICQAGEYHIGDEENPVELGRRIGIEKKAILKKLKNNKDHRMFGRKRGGNLFGYTPREDQQNKKGSDQGTRKSVFTAG